MNVVFDTSREGGVAEAFAGRTSIVECEAVLVEHVWDPENWETYRREVRTRTLHSASSSKEIYEAIASARLERMRQEYLDRKDEHPTEWTFEIGPLRRIVALEEVPFDEAGLVASEAWSAHLEEERIEAERQEEERRRQREAHLVWKEKNDRETYERLKARFEPVEPISGMPCPINGSAGPAPEGRNDGT